MTMPGFTAEASLRDISQSFATEPGHPRLVGVAPQFSATCSIDQDGTAASGHTVYWCHLVLDGVDVNIPPGRVLQ
jgi:hypothetical protein